MSLLTSPKATAKTSEAPAAGTPPAPPASPLDTAVDHGKPPAPPPAASERPDYIPEKFWKDGKADLESLAKSYAEAEKKVLTKTEELAAQVRADLFKERPEAADKYEVKPIEGVRMDELVKHPAVVKAREISFEAGLSNEKFNGIITSMIDILKDGGVDQAAEKAQLGDNADVRLNAVATWAKAQAKDDAEFSAIADVAKTAAGVRLLERLMGTAAAPSNEIVPPVPALTIDDLKKMQNDPRYWDASRREAAFVKQVDDGFAKLYAKK